jgi:hypothetical protein
LRQYLKRSADFHLDCRFAFKLPAAVHFCYKPEAQEIKERPVLAGGFPYKKFERTFCCFKLKTLVLQFLYFVEQSFSNA